MREHQIVVNLKAQQFEQLQKLARERGYKSVTAYVKQKVLELALGLEPEQSTEPAMTPSGGAVADLKRIHGELRSFLEELSVPTQLSGMAAPAPQRNALEIAPPDEDFAWSPTIATPGTGRVSFDLGQKATFESSPAVIPQASSLSQSSSMSQDSGDPLPLPQVLPSSNLGGFGFGLGYSSFSGSNSARFQTPFSSGDRLSGYRDIMDDMEELADRAFAISPRLGALDENVDDQPEENSRGGGRRRSIEVEEKPAQTSEESWDFSSIDKEEEQSALAEIAVSAEPASFVAPIVPANLPGVEELAELEHQEKLEQERELQAQRERDQQVELAKQQSLLAAAERAEQMALREAADAVVESSMAEPMTDSPVAEPVIEPVVRRRSAAAPMLPPPDEIEDGPRAPTYVPPPAPLPPRVSQTNIPAMASPTEIASSLASSGQVEEFGADEPVDLEDDLLSDLLDSNLAAAHVAHSHRDQSEPNPFAVSLSFELEAAAMEEQTPIGQVAMQEEALLEEAEADEDVSANISTVSSSTGSSAEFSTDGVTTTDKVPNSKTTSDSEDQSVNAPTFSGTPPPKRRRT